MPASAVVGTSGSMGCRSALAMASAFTAPACRCLSRRVGDVMTAPPITVEAGTRVDEALELMTRRRIRHLPVIEQGQMCGFISIGDLVKSRIDEVEYEAAAMRNYIQTA